MNPDAEVDRLIEAAVYAHRATYLMNGDNVVRVDGPNVDNLPQHDNRVGVYATRDFYEPLRGGGLGRDYRAVTQVEAERFISNIADLPTDRNGRVVWNPLRSAYWGVV